VSALAILRKARIHSDAMGVSGNIFVGLGPAVGRIRPVRYPAFPKVPTVENIENYKVRIVEALRQAVRNVPIALTPCVRRSAWAEETTGRDKVGDL
jgi:hypothetical protein